MVCLELRGLMTSIEVFDSFIASVSEYCEGPGKNVISEYYLQVINTFLKLMTLKSYIQPCD